MNNYLIPANSKKSQLILSVFTPLDLGILITGIVLSFLLLWLVKVDDLMSKVGLAMPAIIAVFLVLPIPNYHNVRTLIRNVWVFFTNNRTYIWRGWCACYGDRKNK